MHLKTIFIALKNSKIIHGVLIFQMALAPMGYGASEIAVSLDPQQQSLPGVTSESVRERQEAESKAGGQASADESLAWLGDSQTLSRPEEAESFADENSEEIQGQGQPADVSGSAPQETSSELQASQGDGSFLSTAYHLLKLQVEKAWRFATGKGVKVAVIDSGIDLSHPDLEANIYTNTHEIEGNGIDDDQNGFIDDVHGWDFVNSDNDAADDQGHGTHVAGIIGALQNMATGLGGIAREATLIPIKVLNAANKATGKVLEAIRYAVDLGARVINLSLGGGGLSSLGIDRLAEIRSTLSYARDHGAVIVAAAGNGDGQFVKTPADVNDYIYAGFSDTIAVGASDARDQHSGFTNIGSELDFTAPGVNVLSTTAGFTGYNAGLNSGSSMAAPMVAGIAALLLEQDPTLNFDGVYRRLQYSSLDLGNFGRDAIFGYGRVDALKALEFDYYDGGAVKTHWLSEPDSDGIVRYDYDVFGRILEGRFHDGRSFSQVFYGNGVLQRKEMYSASGVREWVEHYDPQGQWAEVEFTEGARVYRNSLEAALRASPESRAAFELMFHLRFPGDAVWTADSAKMVLDVIRSEALFRTLSEPDFAENLNRLLQLHERLEDRNEEFGAIQVIPLYDRWLGDPRYAGELIRTVRSPDYNPENLLYQPRAEAVLLASSDPRVVFLTGIIAKDREIFETVYGVSSADQQLTNAVYLQRLNAILENENYTAEMPFIARRTGQGLIQNLYNSEGQWIERRILSSDGAMRLIQSERLDENSGVSSILFGDGRERHISELFSVLERNSSAANFIRQAFGAVLDFNSPSETRQELMDLARHSDLFNAVYQEPLSERFEALSRLHQIAAGVPDLFSELFQIPLEGQTYTYRPYVETLIRLMNTTHFTLEEPFPPQYDSAARPTRYFFHADGYLQRVVTGYASLTTTREYNADGGLIRVNNYSLTDAARAIRATADSRRIFSQIFSVNLSGGDTNTREDERILEDLILNSSVLNRLYTLGIDNVFARLRALEVRLGFFSADIQEMYGLTPEDQTYRNERWLGIILDLLGRSGFNQNRFVLTGDRPDSAGSLVQFDYSFNAEGQWLERKKNLVVSISRVQPQSSTRYDPLARRWDSIQYFNTETGAVFKTVTFSQVSALLQTSPAVRQAFSDIYKLELSGSFPLTSFEAEQIRLAAEGRSHYSGINFAYLVERLVLMVELHQARSRNPEVVQEIYGINPESQTFLNQNYHQYLFSLVSLPGYDAAHPAIQGRLQNGFFGYFQFYLQGELKMLSLRDGFGGVELKNETYDSSGQVTETRYFGNLEPLFHAVTQSAEVNGFVRNAYGLALVGTQTPAAADIRPLYQLILGGRLSRIQTDYVEGLRRMAEAHALIETAVRQGGELQLISVLGIPVTQARLNQSAYVRALEDYALSPNYSANPMVLRAVSSRPEYADYLFSDQRIFYAKKVYTTADYQELLRTEFFDAGGQLDRVELSNGRTYRLSDVYSAVTQTQGTREAFNGLIGTGLQGTAATLTVDMLALRQTLTANYVPSQFIRLAGLDLGVNLRRVASLMLEVKSQPERFRYLFKGPPYSSLDFENSKNDASLFEHLSEAAQLDALLGEPRFESQIRRLPASIQQHLEDFFGGIYPDYLTLQDGGDQAVDGNGYTRRDLWIHLGSVGEPGQLRTLHFIFIRSHANNYYGAEELIEEDVAGTMLIRSPAPNSIYIDRFDPDGMYQGAIYGDSFYGAFFFEGEPLAAHSYFEAVLEVSRSQGRAIVAPPTSFRQRLTDTLGVTAQVFSLWQPELGLAFLNLAKAVDFADSYDLKNFIEKLEVSLPFFQSHQDLVSKVYGLMPNDQNTMNPAYLQLVFQLTQRFGSQWEGYSALLTRVASLPNVTDRQLFLENLLVFHQAFESVRGDIERVYGIARAAQNFQNQSYFSFLERAVRTSDGNVQKVKDQMTAVIQLDRMLGPAVNVPVSSSWAALNQVPANVRETLLNFYGGAPIPNTQLQIFNVKEPSGVSTIRVHILYDPTAYSGAVRLQQLYFKRLGTDPYQLKYLFERDEAMNIVSHDVVSGEEIQRFDAQSKAKGSLTKVAGFYVMNGRFLKASNPAEALREALGYEGVRNSDSNRDRFSAVFGVPAGQQLFSNPRYRAKLLELTAAANSAADLFERMHRVYDMDQVLGLVDTVDHRGEAMSVLNRQPGEVKQGVLTFFGGSLPAGIKNISINNKPDEAGVETIRVVVYFDPDVIPGPVQYVSLFFKKAPGVQPYKFRYFFENTLNGTVIRQGTMDKGNVIRRDASGRLLEKLTVINGRYYLGTRRLSALNYWAALNESRQMEGIQPVLSRRARFSQLSGIRLLDQRLLTMPYQNLLWQMSTSPLSVSSLLQMIQ